MIEPIRFKVSTGDRTFTGSIGLADQVAIERKFDISILELFGSHAAERLAYGAWHSLRRRNTDGVGEDFEAWVQTVESVLNDEAEEAPKEEAPAAQPAG